MKNTENQRRDVFTIRWLSILFLFGLLVTQNFHVSCDEFIDNPSLHYRVVDAESSSTDHLNWVPVDFSTKPTDNGDGSGVSGRGTQGDGQLYFNSPGFTAVGVKDESSYSTPGIGSAQNNIEYIEVDPNPQSHQTAAQHVGTTPKFGFIAGTDQEGNTLTDKYNVVGSPPNGDITYAPVAETDLSSILNDFGITAGEELKNATRDAEGTEDEAPPEEDQLANNKTVDKPPTTPNRGTRHLSFPSCIDAKARGYSGSLICCSVKNGDFNDPSVWDCNRTPTLLDAVFVRHFVRLTSADSKVRVRALWLIDSIDPDYVGQSGSLRSGRFPNGLCDDPQVSQLTLGLTELRALTTTFRSLLGGSPIATLPELCGAVVASPFEHESDFKLQQNVVLRIADVGVPVDVNIAAAVAAAAHQQLATPKPKVNEEGEMLIPVETVQALMQAQNYLRKDENQNEDADTEDASEEASPSRDPMYGFTPEEYKELQASLVQLGLEDTETPNSSRRFPDRIKDEITDEDDTTTAPGVIRDASNSSLSNSRRLQASADPPSTVTVTGDSTLRIEANASLLFFEDSSIILDGDIRNDGTVFLGEATMTACLIQAGASESNICRIPSLDVTGSIIAMRPIEVKWLQLGRGAQPAIASYYFGPVQYSNDLPNSERSTLTMYGNIEVGMIFPGFHLSFKRIGFPPYPAPPARPKETAFKIQNPSSSSDLVIYTDVFDDDGFINCCEAYYEEDVAKFVVTGTNVAFHRYSSALKSMGDFSNEALSEQILIRAPSIRTGEAFFGLSPIILPQDSMLTNVDTPVKTAGRNKDTLYFQCYEMCMISNQTFKNSPPYRFVQVTRKAPR